MRVQEDSRSTMDVGQRRKVSSFMRHITLTLYSVHPSNVAVKFCLTSIRILTEGSLIVSKCLQRMTTVDLDDMEVRGKEIYKLKKTVGLLLLSMIRGL